MTKQNKTILVLLGATAACVTIGLLLANKKDKNFSEKIANKGADFVSKLGDLIGKGKKKAEAYTA